MATRVKILIGLCMLVGLASTLPSPSAVRQGLCFDESGAAYAGLVPNPNSCGSFYHCHEQTPGNPSPVLGLCPEPLLYSFERCVCDWPSASLCFDSSNQEHVGDFFKCANPLIASGSA